MSAQMKCSGLVLAGGKSSRMGTDKALLLWRGTSLLSHAVRNLEAVVGSGNVIVSGARKYNNAIADQISGIGPLGGIHAVLARECILDPRWFLIMPVDMPLINGDLLMLLRDEVIEASKNEARAVCFRDKELPGAFFADLQTLEILTQLCGSTVDPKDRSLREFWLRMQPNIIVVPAHLEKCFRNINSPTDWNSLMGEEHEASL